MKVMLADDDESIRLVVEHIVADEGYEFCYACDGQEALSVLEEEKPNLLILDVMMPKMDGYSVCEKIRKNGVKIPIIFLSAKGDIVDKTIGFRAGGDDYLVKPFSSVELALRIDALLRRNFEQNYATNVEKKDRLVIGDLDIYFSGYEVKLRGKKVDLTSKEFEILSVLAASAGRVFTREQLIKEIWGSEDASDINSITVFIRKIREKIEDDPSKPKYLLTVWRVGYKFIDKL